MRRVVRGAREAVQRQRVAFGDRLAERGARLDEAVEVGAHRERAGRDERDRVEQRGRGLAPSRRRSPRRAASTVDGDAGVGLGVGVADRRRGRLERLAQVVLAIRRATETTACASRGIALRLLPPSSETSRNGTVAYASRSARPSTLTAFERPSWMFVPECPPRPPLDRDRQRRRAPSSSGLALAARSAPRCRCSPRSRRSASPSSSLSRLTRIVPSTQRAVEAVRPLEPDLLGDRHQQLRAARAGATSSSTSAIIAAIATPSSAPSVVPFAVSHSPSRTSSIRPSAGIVRTVGLALADHVEVPLQHHLRRRLAARASPARRRRGCAPRPGAPGSRAPRPRRARTRSPAPRGATAGRSWSAARNAPRTRRLDPRQNRCLGRHTRPPGLGEIASPFSTRL